MRTQTIVGRVHIYLVAIVIVRYTLVVMVRAQAEARERRRKEKAAQAEGMLKGYQNENLIEESISDPPQQIGDSTGLP